MLFWNHITGLFNKKSKQEKVQRAPPVLQVIEHSSESETQTTTSSTVSNREEEVPSIPVQTPLPEVEFEQSRNLLQLDFFGSTQEKEIRLASFPKFDYLLEANKKTPNTESTLKKSRKSSTTLRHRISLYRPTQQKSVKRSLSTPDIYNSK